VKVITIPPQATEVHELLAQARDEDLIVKAADGVEFLVTAVNEFDEELARGRRNERLMELLDERASQSETVPLDEVKRRLGLS
jgi:hypothetical protein